jgi:hypothetical protein
MLRISQERARAVKATRKLAPASCSIWRDKAPPDVRVASAREQLGTSALFLLPSQVSSSIVHAECSSSGTCLL